MAQLKFTTNASEADVVKAFRSAFFTPPTIGDYFKPTPLGHFRSVLRWAPTDVISAAAGAKLESVSFTRRLEDAQHWRSEVGETIGVEVEPGAQGASVRLWVDNEPMIAGVDVPSPLVLWTYAHEIGSLLKEAGFTVSGEDRGSDYATPPNAPPGWPFGQ
jgi:hypothetical protein